MRKPHTAAYIPLATQRTKDVIKNLRPGAREKIDVENTSAPHDRLEVDAWIVVEEHGEGRASLWFDDGPSGAYEFGYADEVRELIAEAMTAN